MDNKEYEEALIDLKTSLKPDEFVIAKPPVVDELGQVKYDGYLAKFKPVFPDIPWRTVRDNKGVMEMEINKFPSQLDLTDYVDNRDVISKLVRNMPEKVLLGLASAQTEDGDYTSDSVNPDNDDYEEFAEGEEPLDNLTNLANQIASGNEQSENTESTSEDKPSANEPEQSEGEDK